MASVRAGLLPILLLASFANAARIRVTEPDNSIINDMRNAPNETNAQDSLNLPANASSIRENITDTFSCENRTYGYYADVDNECQVFHVCLPTKSGSRNVTYRWSFICPKETIFNQEFLTCTRPADSIDCKDAPDYYQLSNMEMGKESKNKTEESKDKKDNRKIQKRKPEKRKENIVMGNMITEDISDEFKDITKPEISNGENAPVLLEAVTESVDLDTEDVEEQERREEDLDRIVMERNLRNERQMKRGAFRFRSDA